MRFAMLFKMSDDLPENRATNRVFMLTLALGILTGFIFAIVLSTPKEFWNSVLWKASRRSADKKIDPKPSSNSSVAYELSKKVRILCWVTTAPYYHWRAKFIQVTWAKRCNTVLFMSTVEDPEIQAIKLPVPEGREFLWAKTKAALKYVYEHHSSEADWFLKADDDTYVIMENLRYLLAPYDSQQPLYFGCRFRALTGYDGISFMSGGAGYVLSYAALRLLVTKGLENPQICSTSLTGAEDLELGRCMKNLGIKLVDTRDSLKRGRFFPLPPSSHFFPEKSDDWYWKYAYHRIKKGLGCCSNFAVTFHYVEVQEMVILEYFMYHLHVYGVKFGRRDTVPNANSTEG